MKEIFWGAFTLTMLIVMPANTPNEIAIQVITVLIGLRLIMSLVRFEKVVVITQKGCPNGYLAHAILSLIYSIDKVFYVIPGNLAEKDMMDAVWGKKVIMVDVSFPEDILNMIKKRSSKFILFDHHKDNEKTVRKFGIFDNERCGAALVYDELFNTPNSHRNPALDFIVAIVDHNERFTEEWKNDPDIQAYFEYLSKYLFTYEGTLSLMDTISMNENEFNNWMKNALIEGQKLCKIRQNKITEAMNNVYERTIKINNEIVNTSVIDETAIYGKDDLINGAVAVRQAILGNEIVRKYRRIAIITMTPFDNGDNDENMVYISVFSDDNTIMTAMDLVHSLGGNSGYRHSAGITLSRERWNSI